MKQRGRDFSIMSLALALHMTRGQILLMGAQEFATWEAYFTEINRKQEPPKTDPTVLAEQLKGVFAAHKGKKKK